MIEGVPIVVAVCNAGSEKQKGYIVHIGGNFGVSAALGEHFGINSTALALVRRMNQTPGAGFGWRQMYGADYAIKTEKFAYAAEIVSLQDGQTLADASTTVSDVSVTFTPKRGQSLAIGWSRDTAQHADFYRIAGAVTIIRNVIFEPMLRVRDKSLFDLTLTTHLKF